MRFFREENAERQPEMERERGGEGGGGINSIALCAPKFCRLGLGKGAGPFIPLRARKSQPASMPV
jgi:hypothetical protein